MDVLKKTWAYFKPYRVAIYMIFFAGLMVTALSMVNPYVTKLVFDRVFFGEEQDLLVPLLAIMFAQTLIRHIIQYFRSYQMEKYSQTVNVKIRDDAFKKFLGMHHDFFDKEKTGHLMTLLSGDIEIVRGLITSTIPTGIEMIISFLFASTILFTMNVWLTMGCFAILPVTFFLTKRYSRQIRAEYSAIREQTAQLSTVAQENINGVRVVRAFAMEDYEAEKFDQENTKFKNAYLSMRKVWARHYWRLALAGNFPYILVILAGGIMAAKGIITIGVYVAFGGYITYLVNPINSISGYISTIQNAMASGEKLYNFLARESMIKNPQDPVSLNVAVSDIVFEDVSLDYGGSKVLRNIDIVIPKGRKLGIMGSTGSGKTSIINLIGRFYDCSGGRILVNGIDIRKLELDELRKNIAYVMQDTFLFSDSVESNIAFAKPEVEMERIRIAAKAAEADDFIQRMSESYDTVVGERGIGLSGGQKQRIAIARAVIADAPIIVLDDATSSLDMETEHEIQTNFKDVLAGKTQIIIANRVSAVRDADEIIYIKDGEIIERGTHEELVELKGAYAQIFREQYQM
jgi:ATP-binding cassette, subfamily B, multidrug efflux pump